MIYNIIPCLSHSEHELNKDLRKIKLERDAEKNKNNNK